MIPWVVLLGSVTSSQY